MEENGLEQFSIRSPSKGDYADLRNFIAKLESSKSFIIIEGISLTGTKEGGLTLQMQIELTTYFNAPWLKETRKTKGMRAVAERTPASSLASPRAAGYSCCGRARAPCGRAWERAGVGNPSGPAAPHAGSRRHRGLTPVTELSRRPERGPDPEGFAISSTFAESPEERAIRIEKATSGEDRRDEARQELADEEETAGRPGGAAASTNWSIPIRRRHAAALGQDGTAEGSHWRSWHRDRTRSISCVPARPWDDFTLLELGFESATIGYADALVASHPEWKSRKTVIRMGAR
jgi:hypothetical protein